MADFPLNDLLDEQKCYDFLSKVLHPEGLTCPNGHPLSEARVHMRDRTPILDYFCKTCHRHFNLFTRTPLEGTKYRCGQLVQILRGFVQGVSTAQLARELGIDRGGLLLFRHKLQGFAEAALPKGALPDRVLEADEMYQNAGEKRHTPPRSRRSTQAARQQSSRSRDLGN